MKPDKNPSEEFKDRNEESDMIDQKLERLQKKNKAESIALKKLLHGLEKMGKAPLQEVKPNKKTNKTK
jgi:hypothetical protein